jgi:hypothetical protein
MNDQPEKVNAGSKVGPRHCHVGNGQYDAHVRQCSAGAGRCTLLINRNVKSAAAGPETGLGGAFFTARRIKKSYDPLPPRHDPRP